MFDVIITKINTPDGRDEDRENGSRNLDLVFYSFPPIKFRNRAKSQSKKFGQSRKIPTMK